MSDESNGTVAVEKKSVFGLEIDAKRTSSSGDLLIAPEDIKLGTNGRFFDHEDADIEEMYQSYCEPGERGQPQGQLQAVEVRRVGKGVELVFGYRRVRAALLFNQRHPDKRMYVKCKVTTCNEEEARKKNVTENRVARKPSPVDDAHNQRYFREQCGWSEKTIQRFFDHSPSYVAKLAKIPGLPFDVQRQIHKGELSIDAALGLGTLPAAEQKAVAAEAEQTGETLSQVATRKVRAKKIEQGERLARSLKEVREFHQRLLVPENPENLRNYAQNMLWFIEGRITDEQFAQYITDSFPDLNE